MIIKSHLCGIAVAFNRFDDSQDEYFKDEPRPTGFFNYDYNATGRPQGSLYSQQKRKIADACEYMRLNAIHKPRIFVLTSPGYTNLANEKYLIQKFCHNLRNGYKVRDYLWVREATQRGYPHFHFIADMPDFDGVAMSLYWSSLFNSDATNSVRKGTAPRCSKCRTKLKFSHGQYVCPKGCTGFKKVVDYWIKDKKMSWYLCKYIGKGINQTEKNMLKKPYLDFKDEGWFYRDLKLRTFAITQKLSIASQPTEYKSKMVRVDTGRKAYTVSGEYVPFQEDQRIFQNCTSFLTEDEVRKKWNWQYTGFYNTYKGYPKEWKLKKR